jgi:primosomal protein N' (replication factor Y)
LVKNSDGGYKSDRRNKKGFFYPWKNLSQIVIDQSGDLNHKQWDQSPRYHTREVAEIMATIYGAKLNLVSVLPDPTTFLKIKQGQIRYLRLAAKPTARIDWQTNPDWDWNGLAISQKINQVKTAAGPLIVLVNRLAYGQIIKCRDCGFIWECPGCHSPLHYSRKNNQAYCGHCHFQTNLPLSCPHCRGQNIATVGLGQEKILAQLTRAYPTKKIEVFNAQSLELDKRAEILICSKAIFPYLNQQSFAGVIIPVLEQFLTPADLTTQWELFYLLKLLSAHRLDIFVQSFSEHNFASYFKNPLAYLKTELKNLEQLHLPPFTTLVKIAVRHRSLSQAEKQAQSLWQKIKQSLPRVEIAAPQLALPPRQDNQYRYNLIISRVNSGDIAKLAELSYAEGTLDINPLSLLD